MVNIAEIENIASTSEFDEFYIKERARTVFQQTLGLMFRKPGEYCMEFDFPRVQRLLIVHTFFMRFPIDIIFYDAKDEVVKWKLNMKPWRVVVCRNVKRFVEKTSYI